MRFVKGDKKVPFYENNKAVDKNKGNLNANVQGSDSIDKRPNSQKYRPTTTKADGIIYTAKPGSVTDVLNLVKSDKLSSGGATVAVFDAEKPQITGEPIKEEKITLPTEPVVKNSFSDRLKVLDEIAPLPEARAKKSRKIKSEKNKGKGKGKSRVAVISSVVGLSLIIIATSVYGFLYFNELIPVNLLDNVSATENITEHEELILLPMGSPVTEYELLSANIENSTATALELSLASAKDLLEIRVVDSSGQLVEGLPLEVTIVDPEGDSNSYDIGDNGSLELDELEIEGRYAVILHPVEGYPIVEPKFINIKLEIDTTPIDAETLKDIVKDESEVDVSKEDSLYNGSSSADSDGTAPAPATVITPVPSDKDGTTETVGAETYYLPKDGVKTFTITDGEHSGDYIFTLDGNGRIIGAVKVVPVTASVNTLSGEYSTFNFISSLFINTNNTVDTTSGSRTSVTDSSLSLPGSSSEVISSSSSASTPSSSSESTDSGSSSGDDNQQPTTTETVSNSILFSGSGNNLLMREPFSGFAVKYESVGETIYYGWHTINGDEYYYDVNGNIITGYVSINGVFYTFSSDGKLQKSITDGIDVSKYQPNIDWNAVKASGIDFAIIRVGYRGYSYGTLVEDPYYRQHIEGAINAGLKVGIYIYSQAITVQEAIEEASFCLQMTSGYTLEYGITFDTEYEANGGRANSLSTALRTEIANTFCDTIRQGGRVPMIYSNKSWLLNQLDYTAIDHNRIWLAHYTAQTDFAYRYDIWQYTSTGNVAGISGNCDMNFSYIIP